MARTFTLLSLVTRCQQRCDLENSEIIGAAEWKSLVSLAYAELYSILVASGMRYFETTATVTADGSASYALPNDHMSTVGVDRVLVSSRYELVEVMAQERNITSGLTSGDACFYALVGANLKLFPPPSSGTYEHVYVAQPADLSSGADDDEIDVVVPSGEAFVVWHVVVNAKTKEESDVGGSLAERERARTQVTEWSTLRAINTPRRRIVDRDPYIYGREEGDYNRSGGSW